MVNLPFRSGEKFLGPSKEGKPPGEQAPQKEYQGGEEGEVSEGLKPAEKETFPTIPPLSAEVPSLSREEKAAPLEPELSPPHLGPEEVKEAKKVSPLYELRWLGEWWERQLKKLPGAKINRREDLTFLEVLVPRDNEVKPDAAEQMFAALAGLYRGGPPSVLRYLKKQVGLSFEIVADHEHIHFVVAVPKELADLAEKQIHGAYPSAEVNEVPEYDIFQKEGYVSFAELGTSGPKYFSLRTYKDLGEVDPLNGITSALTKLSEGEAAVIQIAVSPASKRWQRQGQALLIKAKEWEKQPGEVKQKVVLSKELEEGIGKKITKPGFYATVRVVAVSPARDLAEAHLGNILASLEQLSYPHLASFVRKKIWFKKSFIVDFLYRHIPRIFNWTIFSSEELATIFHFPNKGVVTPNIKWLEAKSGVAPLNLPPEGLYLGATRQRGAEKKVYIQKDDRRRHVYIVGQTGTGKSELLKFMAYQDILAGEGVCFIDPHGDTVEDILKMIPDERVDDVIYFNPGDTKRPPGLNILEAETEEGKHLAINSFIALLYKLYDPNRTGIMGPRLERAIRNVMLTAMNEEGNTLIEVLRLLTDPSFAATKIPLITDPLVKRYWTDELAQTSDFHKSEVLGYFVAKFDRFVTEKIMRNIIGQKRSSFNFREVMDKKKILLVNLSKGRIGEENSNFLGLILVPRILTAAMSRVDVPEEQRPDFYLYVDEFQNFATPDFVQILSEARKYRLNLTVANQFIGQLEENIKNAVFGNVGTSILFRVGSDDAEYLEKQVAPHFSKSDLLNLPLGQTYLKLLISSAPSIPFSMKTDWPAMRAVSKNAERAERIREISLLKYTRSAEEVEEEVRERAML